MFYRHFCPKYRNRKFRKMYTDISSNDIIIISKKIKQRIESVLLDIKKKTIFIQGLYNKHRKRLKGLGGRRMKKKIICAILVTALAVTSFTGCGKAQDKDTAEVIMAETETRDPDITAEAQAAVDTLLPTETGKPVVTETATPTPKPVATKEPETTATPKAAATAKPKATATAKPKATATPKPATTAGSGTTVAAASTPAPVPTPAPCNHNYVKEYWPSAPTCNGGGDWTMVCSICGDVGATGTDPALPHTPETRVEVDATYCDEHGVRVTYCTSCGNELGREGFDGTEHEWVTGTSDPIWDWDKQDFVTEEVTYCSRCHAQR